MNCETCRKCGNALEQPATGRPKIYCGTACRRSAELEITRLGRHLERLEAERLELNVTDRTGIRDTLGRTSKTQLADCEKNIDALEGRMILLLEGSTDE